MTKLLMWVGVLVGIWSLTNSGSKSAYYVLSVLVYTAVVFMVTFRFSRKALQETFGQEASS